MATLSASADIVPFGSLSRWHQNFLHTLGIETIDELAARRSELLQWRSFTEDRLRKIDALLDSAGLPRDGR